jgi:hypothetical protein
MFDYNQDRKMKYLKRMVSMCLLVFFANTIVYSQSGDFNIDLYKNFLGTHQDLSTEQLLEMHPAGLFEKKISSGWHTALYHDSIEAKFELTKGEISLINKHGFVVTSRLGSESFGAHFVDIYRKDMPVFVSTDAILHAFHSSYDRTLTAGFNTKTKTVSRIIARTVAGSGRKI